MEASKWAFFAALLASFTGAQAADFSVSHYEPLRLVDMRASSAGVASGHEARKTAAPQLMRFDAMGKSFELQLELNNRLMAAASKNPLLGEVEIYRGDIAGRAGSWARIVMADGMPRGMFFDGQDLYAIEAPGDSGIDTDVPVIFSLADMYIAPGSVSCGNASLATAGRPAAEALLSELPSMSEAQGALSEIDLGAIGDFEFTSSKGGDANAAAAITTRLNNVDGIFSAQVGVQINVSTIETFSNPADPFSDTLNPTDLLDELSNYRSTTPTQNRNGLTHLYTGKNLNTTTVGIAWNGALCSNFFGAGLSEGNGSATFDSLIAAHEIGHNFGAPHDGEAGSPCAAETGNFIMTPRQNGSDQFSACSIREMADDIAAASCISALPAVDMRVALQSSPTILFGAATDLSYEVANSGTLGATNVTAEFTVPANLAVDAATSSTGTCTSVAGTVSCALGDIAGLASRTVDITVTPVALGAGTASATVAADIDDWPGNNQQSVQLSVDPAANLFVDRPAGAAVEIDSSTTITTGLGNRATMDATGVTLVVNLGAALQATAASWPLGSCTVQPQQVSCQASVFAAQSASSISVTATGVSAGRPSVSVSMASFEADLDTADNSNNARIEVLGADEDSGAGSTGPIALWLLMLVAMLRRRR
jgi:hypothetical protein